MLKTLSMLSLLVAGVIAGLVLSGRAIDRAEIIALHAGRGRGRRRAAGRTGGRAGADAAAPTSRASPRKPSAPSPTSRRCRSCAASASPFANDPFFQYFFGDQGEMFGRSRAEQSLGSGVVISSDGYVVTNNHVIGDDVAEVTVTVGDHRDVKREDHRRRFVDRPRRCSRSTRPACR